MSNSVGAISYGKPLLRLMSSVCKVSVIEDELSYVQGVAIVQDMQCAVFVNVVKISSTDSTLGVMHVKHDAAFEKLADANKFKKGYLCKRPSTGIRGDATGAFSDL